MIGKKLAHYEITEKLGAGGMGEVYRARDPKLQRDVALKILPEGVAENEERLGRFKREARLLASLNHPNIGSIFGLEESSGHSFLVLEIVEGEDLAHRLERGPLGTDEALQIARQITDALEAAHEQGIIHRDLKPSNIKLKPDGQVKVLDFGLAKALDTESGSQELSNSPTVMASSPTVAGVILGTAGYMSPEQARGRPVDRRADIWAFGVVLYEMLCGGQLFVGETVSDTLAAVLRADVDLDKLPGDIPAPVRRLLQRCLDRDPRTRLRDIGEARIAVDRVLGGESDETPAVSVETTAAPRRAPLSRLAPWALVVAAAAVAAGLYLRQEQGNDAVVRAYVPPPKNSSYHLVSSHPGPAAISRDGSQIAFSAVKDGELVLWVRDLDALAPRPLPGTVGAGYPFWSPDGRSIGFFADGKLKRVDASGGPPFTICEASNGKGGSWNEDGTIVFAPAATTGIHRVRAAGGEAVQITEVARDARQNSNRFPQFLPDGRHFLYFARAGDESAIRVASLSGDVDKEVLRCRAQGFYAGGYLLFLRETTLMAQPFDPSGLALSGEAAPVADDIRFVASIPLAVFSVSETGVLIYQTGEATEGSQMRWLDRSGNQVGTTGGREVFGDFQISPDEKRICIEVNDASTSTADLWIYDIETDIRSRFTFDPSNDFDPVWSPDGSEIIFCSERSGQFDLYRKSVEGDEQEVLIYASPDEKHAYDWSRDGRFVLFQAQDSTNEVSVWALDLQEESATRLTEKGTSCYRPSLSPDDRWFVYRAFESGKRPVYVRSFPNVGRKWQVSSGDGTHPRWSASGNIYYQTLNGEVLEVPVKTRESMIELGQETPLFDTRAASKYNVSSDGSHFLEVFDESSDLSSPLVLVVNWVEDFQRRN